MHIKLWQGQVMVEELEQLVAKRFERGTPESGIDEFVQVTKDKMLAEKDEELRRMQEMLAQMQVTMFWTHVDVQFSTISSHIWTQSSKPYLYPRLKPP